VTVTAIPVPHGQMEGTYGYRFETADRTIVISGDTRASEAIAEACSGCDILVHEVFSDEGLSRRSPVWQEYHSSAHTSAGALGELATRARPSLLVLYHQMLWGPPEETLLAELRAGYDGEVVYGQDLDIF